MKKVALPYDSTVIPFPLFICVFLIRFGHYNEYKTCFDWPIVPFLTNIYFEKYEPEDGFTLRRAEKKRAFIYIMIHITMQ